METKEQSINKKSIHLRQGYGGQAVESRKSKVSIPQSAIRNPHSQGFTLIELLVAMGLLMIIVLMLANLFQQSTRAWNSGMRQAEVGLEARSAINIIQQDLNQAVCATNVTFNPVSFDVLTDSATNGLAIQSVSYTTGGNSIARNVDGGEPVDLIKGSIDDFDVTPHWIDGSGPGLPDYVDVSLSMTSSKDYSEVRVYVAGRGWDEPDIDPTDVIDTTRGD